MAFHPFFQCLPFDSFLFICVTLASESACVPSRPLATCVCEQIVPYIHAKRAILLLPATMAAMQASVSCSHEAPAARLPAARLVSSPRAAQRMQQRTCRALPAAVGRACGSLSSIDDGKGATTVQEPRGAPATAKVAGNVVPLTRPDTRQQRQQELDERRMYLENFWCVLWIKRCRCHVLDDPTLD